MKLKLQNELIDKLFQEYQRLDKYNKQQQDALTRSITGLIKENKMLFQMYEMEI